MKDFIAQYGTEATCYRALYRARWPNGSRCPTCANRSRSRFRRDGRIYYQCRACRHQTTLVGGTLFEGTKLPLTTWFLGLYLLTSTKTNRSALELKRHLDVRYRTAWRLKHKVMQAMTAREETSARPAVPARAPWPSHGRRRLRAAGRGARFAAAAASRRRSRRCAVPPGLRWISDT